MPQHDGEKIRPLVSVCVTTYNHESYIRSCLDGILAQETDFLYEICVGEDESSDGTRAICLEYAESHPLKIRLFLRSRQDVLYIAGRPTGRYNFLETIKACRGTYIAFCEGDDYWTHPRKLQKQVKFLEAHPRQGMVHAAHILRYDDSSRSQQTVRRAEAYDEDMFWRILEGDIPVATCSVLCRAAVLHRICNEFQDEYKKFLPGDAQTWFHFARLYGVGYIDEVLCVYRKPPSGATSITDPKRRVLFLEGVLEHRLYLAKTYGVPAHWSEKIKKEYVHSLLQESLVARDAFRVRQYGNEHFAGKKGALFCLRLLLLLKINSRWVIEKAFRWLEKAG